MEKVSLVKIKSGRTVHHGLVTMIGGISFCIVPVKAEHVVYFGLTGANGDFLQVYAEPWNGDKDSIELATEQGTSKLEKLRPEEWCYTYSARVLGEVRAKKKKVHAEYKKALEDDYNAYHEEVT